MYNVYVYFININIGITYSIHYDDFRINHVNKCVICKTKIIKLYGRNIVKTFGSLEILLQFQSVYIRVPLLHHVITKGPADCAVPDLQGGANYFFFQLLLKY